MKKYRMYNKFSGKSFPSDHLYDVLGLYYSLICDYKAENKTDLLNFHLEHFVIQVLKGGEYVDYDYKTDF